MVVEVSWDRGSVDKPVTINLARLIAHELARYDHVHDADGQCIKNRFGKRLCDAIPKRETT